MSRRYARVESTGERVLHEITCDRPGCRAAIRPNPDIAKSGWVKCSLGSDVVADYCPEHARLI